MNRPTIIATVVAATGVLVAGSVAGLAVVNAVSSTPADSSTVAVVAAAPPAQGDATAVEGTEATELPQIAQPTPQDEVTSQAPGVAPISVPAAPKEIPSAAARKAVVKAAPGSVVSITKGSRQGLKAWAVQVERQDGSIVTGYVDRESGVVFDWTLDKKAPVVTYTEEEEYEDDDREEDQENEDHDDEDHDDEGEDDDD